MLKSNENLKQTDTPSESPAVATPEANLVMAQSAVSPVRLAITGKLKVGKDHVAKAIGAEIHGLADPIYSLCQHFFGTDDKDAEGMRQTMQIIGQWGRALVGEDYPLSPIRVLFCMAMQTSGQHFCGPGSGVNCK